MLAQKPLRSYGRKRGRRLRETKQQLMDELLPKLGIEDWGLGTGEVLTNPESQIPNPLWIEIGAGGGEHAAHQAEQNPNVGYIACEPYINGLSHLLQVIHDKNLQNIRIHGGDARDVLTQLPTNSIERAFILFPDPWPKVRHHKRRLIQQPLLDVLSNVMKPGAQLRIATDHVDYLGWILSHMLVTPHFKWLAKRHTDWSEMPADAIITRYQQKAANEGRVATYLDFERI